MSSIIRISSQVLFTVLVLAIAIPAAKAAKWRAISPEEFAAESSRIDPGYGAEILFSEGELSQRLGDRGTAGTFDFYKRVKVFDRRGVEQVNRVEIAYTNKQSISGIRARTIKPDGTVIELDKSDIFDQEIFKIGYRKYKAKTFAFPGLEPGDIVELQYSKDLGPRAFFIELNFLEWLPARKVSRRIKPFRASGIGYKIARFQYPDANITDTKRGYYEFERTNVPAKKEEPFTYADIHLEPTVLLYYYSASSEPNREDTYWNTIAKRLLTEGRTRLKSNADVSAKAKSVVDGIADDEERLKALYLFCQDNITNHDYSYGVYTTKELEKLPENRLPSQTLKRGHGTPEDINALFGAMARSLGYEANLAYTQDAEIMFFRPDMTISFSMDSECISVKLDGRHRFYSPGNPFLAPGALEWWRCGNYALTAKKKGDPFVVVPMRASDYSLRRRKGAFEIDETGTLTGRVSIEYTGLSGLTMKEELSARLSAKERQDFILDELMAEQPLAKVSNFLILNRGSSIAPLEISYDLKILEFADVTGKRIFVQPAVFHKGKDPLFTEDKRINDVVFQHPWSEEDRFEITYPEGFELEKGNAPAALNLGQLGELKNRIRLTKSSRTISYERAFKWDAVVLGAEFYDAIKETFLQIRYRDHHALTFKRSEN